MTVQKKYIAFLILSIVVVIAILYWPSRWNYIVIHHSAGKFGNIEHLRKVHKERQPHDPIDAIAYHYIIGNGNGLGDGIVDSDSRKQFDIWGGHLRMVNFDKNFRGVGICIIGNLDTHEITSKQFDALVELTKELMTRYNIQKENVLFHGEIKNEQTACPGKNFPKKLYLDKL